MAWLWHTKILHRTFSQINVKLSSSLWTLRQKQKLLGPRKLSLRIMQNFNSLNRFYLTFLHVDSWNFDKILNVLKNYLRFYTNFGDTENFYSNNNKNTNNQCQKFLGKTFFAGSQLTIFENTFMYLWRYFYEKAVLYTTTLIHCKVRQVLQDLFKYKLRKWLRNDVCGRSY